MPATRSSLRNLLDFMPLLSLFELVDELGRDYPRAHTRRHSTAGVRRCAREIKPLDAPRARVRPEDCLGGEVLLHRVYRALRVQEPACLLYTSDAADESRS